MRIMSEAYHQIVRSSSSISAAVAGRMGNKRNPRPATAAEIEELLRTIW